MISRETIDRLKLYVSDSSGITLAGPEGLELLAFALLGLWARERAIPALKCVDCKTVIDHVKRSILRIALDVRPSPPFHRRRDETRRDETSWPAVWKNY